MPKPYRPDPARPDPGTLPGTLVAEAVARALAEDLGLAGDVTTNATIAADASSKGTIGSRADGVVAGIEVAREAFRQVDPRIRFEAGIGDGATVGRGTTVAKLSGPSRGILSAERVALNFLCHMSGIATLTARYVEAAKGTGARICCTRKTNPGLRAFEKYAVRCGGGSSHRYGLFDAVLIKDNHIVAAGGVGKALTAARRSVGHLVKIEIEVDSIKQIPAALDGGADVVMLDNMKPAELEKAVALIAGRALAEASGGVNLDTVRAIAESGVDLISVGALTHSAPVLDLGLDFS